jgi:hypothetical protein
VVSANPNDDANGIQKRSGSIIFDDHQGLPGEPEK